MSIIKSHRKAFTLVELLVVIAIIGLLATLSVIALNTARAKARDTKRVADVKQVTTALEMFYNDAGRYPTSTDLVDGSLSYSGTVYMSNIPVAPNPPDGTCTSDSNTYNFTQDNDGASYTISFCIGGNVGTLTPGNVCATPAGLASCSGGGAPLWACGDALIDSRDSTSYPTVQIGSQCWLAKNMNIGTRIDSGSSEPDCHDVNSPNGWWSCQTSSNEKYCYNNDDSNCTTDGGLYEWAETMGLPYHCNNTQYDCDGTTCTSADYHDCNYPDPTATKRQGICPSGWHIPTFTELQTLAQNADSGCDFNCDSGDCSCTTAGGKLKATGSHSPISWDGTDDYNFSALPSGYRDVNGSFYGRGGSAYLCSSMPYSDNMGGAWGGDLVSGDTTFYGGGSDRVVGFSVRCVKD